MEQSTADGSMARPRPAALWVVSTLLVLICGTLFITAIRYAREAARNARCRGKLKQLGFALENYYQLNGTYPPAYVVDAEGRPMHSWRALLLSSMGELTDYDFTEPWNSPKNLRSADRHPELAMWFHCPSDDSTHPEWTSYIAVTGAETLWPGHQVVMLDNAAKECGTILLIELHESGINWLEPRDVKIGEVESWDYREKLNHPEGFHFVTSLDDVGTLWLAPTEMEILKKMAIRHGGSVEPQP
ncbi:MAG TPA: DUF1559 domain-containing protein [Pirellulales bacterium]|jgi:hypothetical protein